MAEINPAFDDANSKDPVISWDDVTESDTVTAAKWPGGEGFIEVSGTLGGATVQMQFGTDSSDLYDLDSDPAPDGLSFTGKQIVKVDLPIGYIKPSISGGSSQSLTVKVSPKRSI